MNAPAVAPSRSASSGADTARPPSFDGEWDTVALGPLYAHTITFGEAVQAIADRAERRLGGYVVTPNVDHVCVGRKDERLTRAYDDAWLSVVDGQPLMWLARLQRTPLPEKISGSDLAVPLLRESAARGLRVYLFGATPDAAARAKARVEADVEGVHIVGTDSPHFDVDAPHDHMAAAVERLRAARPHLVLVALGVRKQELFMQRFHHQLDGAVLLGVGGVIDFLAGDVRRAPRWMSRRGLEWAWRLAMEPRRLWRRYLVQDRMFAPLLLRAWLEGRRHAPRPTKAAATSRGTQ